MPQLNFPVDEDLRAELEAFAKANSLSLAAAARFLLHRGLDAVRDSGGRDDR
jgi:hypothetical protein